jgi:hypothetical protein
MFETELTKLLRKGQAASDADLMYIAKDNEIAHTVINRICLSLADRLKALEEYVTTQVTHPGNVRYLPEGQEDYLTLKENLDLIYSRLNKIEESVNINALH